MADDVTPELRNHPVVSREEWTRARIALLAREKEFTRLRDEISRARRALPWEKVEKAYTFDTPAGPKTLEDLFDGRSQLVVYHFMFSPAQEAGCKHCSFWADHFDGSDVHLNHRDVTLAVVSRAPMAAIEAFKRRMGWRFTWVSAGDGPFNYDMHVSFKPEEFDRGPVTYNYGPMADKMIDREGISVFHRRAAGEIFHTYSCFARGIDMVNTTYQFLDLAPKGRDEGDQPQSWVRHHDKYE